MGISVLGRVDFSMLWKVEVIKGASEVKVTVKVQVDAARLHQALGLDMYLIAHRDLAPTPVRDHQVFDAIQCI
jgi:hypothetical protein